MAGVEVADDRAPGFWRRSGVRPAEERPRESVVTRPVTTLAGVDVDEGLRLLASRVGRATWLDRSGFLLASFGPRPAWLRTAAVSPLLRAATAEPGGPPETAFTPLPRQAPAGADASAASVGDAPAEPLPGRYAVAFAPEHGDHAVTWAARHRRRLLAPPAAVTALAADKIAALDLFREAGVPVPEHAVIPARDRSPAAAYWPAHWERAVLQRRENNLLGQGTFPLASREELAAALDRLPGRALRLSRHVPGLSLTAGGCVGPDRTVVTAVSHQLVGLPQLGAGWGTHCGNQLVGPSDIGPGRYAAARAAAHAVGEVLRARGYRGVFGLDLLAPDSGAADGSAAGEPSGAGGGSGTGGGSAADGVVAVEINPRFQTVVSLVQAAERHAGLLPSLGLHMLAHLLPELPPVREVTTPPPRLSQLVVHADRSHTLDALPEPGRYRLAPADSAAERLCAADRSPLTAAAPDEALWWPHASPGPVASGDELLLAQFNGWSAPLEPRPRLSPAALRWTIAARGALGEAP
ncbi:hypothetical protein [Streptomyces bohaiensis]|uniref:hypothetical protein n=1 Tax=Streptomyces bohaiensis TaxID=1431344 RepID=UPI003B760392